VSDPLLDRHVRRRLAVLRHAEDMTGEVAITGGVSARSGFVDEERCESLHRLGGVYPAPAGSDEQGPGWLGRDRGNAPGAGPTGAAIIAAETTYPRSAWCCVVWLASGQRSGRSLRGSGHRQQVIGSVSSRSVMVTIAAGWSETS